MFLFCHDKLGNHFSSKVKRLFDFANKYDHFQLIAKHHHQLTSRRYTSYVILSETKEETGQAAALTPSANCKSYVLVAKIHGRAFKLGFSCDFFSQNNLIKIYLECGLLSHGFKVFREMPHRNLVSWTLIIVGAIRNGEFDIGVEVFLDMLRTGVLPNDFALGGVMKACNLTGASKFGLCVHSLSVKVGMEKNPFVASSIIHMYAKSGNIAAAELLFECLDNLDVGCWNAMSGAYAQCGQGFAAISILASIHSRDMPMDKFTFINALKGCADMGNLTYGRQIHGLVVRCGVELCTSLVNSFINMYSKSNDKEAAMRLFHSLHKKDVISWNTVFSGFSQDYDAREVAASFHKLMMMGLKPNHATFSILFRICGELLDVNLGLQFYCLSFQLGFCNSNQTKVSSELIYMFSRCREMEMAQLVFDVVPSTEIITWNEMISGCNFNCLYIESLKLFCNLWKLGAEANECTFSCILEACSKLEDKQIGRQIHGAIVKSGFSSHGYVCSTLIKAYVQIGKLDDSFEFFCGLDRLDLATWGTLISALVHQGYNYEAIKFLYCLSEAGQNPDEFILSSILNACANIAAYNHTKSVHSVVIKRGVETHIFVASAVVDAYAKCGDIKSSKLAFDQSGGSVDVVLLNTMINAYAHHGQVTEAIEIFNKMRSANLKPTQATFVSVLLACSHLGLVDRGSMFVESINLDCGMDLSPNNYGCLVDMLSRNGLLQLAKYVIEELPFPPWPAIWRSLLSGCRIHGNKELGEWAAEKLLQLAPDDNAAYVLLSNSYCKEGSWTDAGALRRKMRERGLPKQPGCSWIEM